MAATKKPATASKAAEEEKTNAEQAQEGQEGAGSPEEGKEPAPEETAAQGENGGAAATPENPPAEDPEDTQEPDGCNTWIYIGPNLPNSKLNCNHVMLGTRKQVTDYLAEIIEEFPQVARLLVPLDRLAEQKMRVRNIGTAMYSYYQDVLSMINALSKKEE